MSTSGLVTIKDITALAHVGRAAVSNWRARYQDFPAPSAESTSRRLYFDREEIIEWLTQHGHHPPLSENQEADLASVITGLQAESKDRESAAETALMLLAISFGENPLSTAAIRKMQTWSDLAPFALDLPTPVRDTIAHAMRSRNGLTRAELDTLRVLSSMKSETPRSISEQIVERLFTDVSRADSVAIGTYRSSASRLLAELARTSLTGGNSIYDPVCGIGDALVQIADTRGDCDYFANDVDPSATAIAVLRLFFCGVQAAASSANIIEFDPHSSLKADVVIAEPPLGPSVTGTMNPTDRRWLSYSEVTGPRIADAGFILDAVHHLSATGSAYVITASNLLTATGLGTLRQRLVAAGQVEAVVELPKGFMKNTNIGTALWVLRASGADQTMLIDATGQKEVESKVAGWLTTIRSGDVPPVPHVSITTADLTNRTTHLRAAPHLYVPPTATEAQSSWLTAANAVETEVARLNEFLEVVDVDSRPDFEKAPVVSIAQLLKLGVVRTVNCHTRPRSEEGSQWNRKILILPLGEVGLMAEQIASDDSGGFAPVPDDYDAAMTGDIAIPIIGIRPSIWVPVDNVGVSSGGRVIRVIESSQLDAEYLNWCVNAKWNEPTATSSGIPRRSMKDIQVPLISLESQKLLVDYLNTLEDLTSQVDSLKSASGKLIDATLTAVRYGGNE
ncbi:N-6 DNA methylase [Brevibacterium sp. NPDC049920]|uniref:N-6 DNA methylase n=1 Tax=Brevibacterium pityocampae TaxID=506594 RepID=A0ABP8J0H5_9MICO